LDGIFKKKSNTHKQWQATKFWDVKHTVDATEPDRLKVKDVYDRLKTIAKSIGQAKTFESKKQPTPRKTLQPESLTKEFNTNQDETEFDLDSVEEEPDMPDLYHRDRQDEELKDEQADAASMPPLTARQLMSSSDASIDLLGDQNDDDDDDDNSEGTEITDGAKFVMEGTNKLVLNLTQTQHSIDDVPEDNKNGGTLTQKETGDTVEAADDNPTQSIEEKVKETEQLFDKAVQEIYNIHLHAPKLQRPESYEDYDFETVAAQATHNYVEEKGTDIEIKWEEKRRNLDRNWNQKREAIEQQHQETLDEQASIQASLATQETDRVRQEHQQIKQEIAATSDDICNQNKSQTRALG
jgi:hypothetical protein